MKDNLKRAGEIAKKILKKAENSSMGIENKEHYAIFVTRLEQGKIRTFYVERKSEEQKEYYVQDMMRTDSLINLVVFDVLMREVEVKKGEVNSAIKSRLKFLFKFNYQ
jgi:phosphoribosylformylglycinamidine (FGAM) synthase PurS component